MFHYTLLTEFTGYPQMLQRNLFMCITMLQCDKLAMLRRSNQAALQHARRAHVGLHCGTRFFDRFGTKNSIIDRIRTSVYERLSSVYASVYDSYT